MNLDQYTEFARFDPQDMLGFIDRLPDQLQSAWELGQSQPLPDWQGIRHVVVAGMGGSAIGADLLSAYLEPLGRLPLILHRDYGLPGWASGPDTLVIASSQSGNTEETLTSFRAAQERGCRILAVTTGGELGRLANEAGGPIWLFTHAGQPRSAVGFSFGLLLAALARLGLAPDPSNELRGAVEAMRRQQEVLHADVPIAQNPAKRLAGQLIGRLIVVLGAGVLAPVARRWKGQMSENAKAWAQFEYIPEADHNTLAGTQHPEDLLGRTIAIFLKASSNYPRDLVRLDLTRQAFMLEGINTDAIDAHGDTPLAQLWTALHFGDYVSFYLAMAYEVNPTPIAALDEFKKKMSET